MASKVESGTIALFDVAYGEGSAGAACVLADGWRAPAGRLRVSELALLPSADYEPGKFYLREMPLILRLFARLAVRPDALVVDGYVWLGGEEKPGLGARLFTALHGAIPVVGIAKTPFRDDTWSTPILRGNSQRPLRVTAAGIDASVAARFVREMHGAHRIPSLVTEVDHLSRATLAGRESCA